MGRFPLYRAGFAGRHDVSMTAARIRTLTVIAAAAGVILVLTACAPPLHHVPKPGSFSTSTPRITPAHSAAPAVTTKPASDYSFGCSNLVAASSLPALFPVAMKSITGAQFARVNSEPGFASDYYVEELGGLDCAWYDGKASNNGATAATSTHDMELTILPVVSSVWKKFLESAGTGVTPTGYTDCSSDSGYNSCQYDGYVNGSWYELDLNNMTPMPPSNQALPGALQSIVSTVNAKLGAGSAAEPNGLQHGTRPLPAEPQELLTAADVKSALGLPASASVTVDCSGQSDGPWTIDEEAATEVFGSVGCSFGTPDGGTYGGYSALAGGEWAAHDAEAVTPGETAVVTLNQPQTSSLYTFTDSQSDRSDDFIYDGSWISFYLYPTAGSDTPGTATPQEALGRLAQLAEQTIG